MFHNIYDSKPVQVIIVKCIKKHRFVGLDIDMLRNIIVTNVQEE